MLNRAGPKLVLIATRGGESVGRVSRSGTRPIAKSLCDYNEDCDWTDYAQLKAKAKEIGRPVEFLIAQSYNNDPFALTGERTRRAEWLATFRRKIS